MKITDTHVYFWHGPFSNWDTSPFIDRNINKEFKNSEQAFMYYKAIHFKDFETAFLIEHETDPYQAKKLGRIVKNFNKNEWAIRGFSYMIFVNRFKFSQCLDHKQELINTGDKILVEASPVDRIWGVGLDEDDPLILDTKNWRGSNLLGKALMKVRKSLVK